MKIVIDAMGGDNGSSIVVSAVKRFHKEFKDVELVVFGKEDELVELKDFCTVIHSNSVVPMEAGAIQVMRMRDSSMMMALKYMKENNCDAIISSGSTGGFLSASTVTLKMIEGVKRAALTAPFPTKIKGKKVTILDIGANNENTPDHLVQFALMGKLYSQAVFNVKEPQVYLINNGTEESKGSPTTKEAYRLLKEQNFPGFKGNLEARNALNGDADVIVTEGFAGNIFLKGAEGVAKMMSGMIKKAFKRNIFSMIGYLLCKKGIKEMTETMDYKSTGGAMLLGVNGVVVKAHGSADDYCFCSALKVARSLAENDVCNKIKEGIKNA